MAIIALVVVTVIVIAAVGYLYLSQESYEFSSFDGTSITTSHSASGDEVTTAHWQFQLSAKFTVGEPMEFWIWNFNPNPGLLILAGVSSNTTGFTFSGSTPSLPDAAPNTTVPEQGTKVSLRFDTPSTGYEGPFRFNLFFDYYPTTGERNRLLSVTETQVVSVHTSQGTSVQTIQIQHPDLVGEYDKGEAFHFTELYRYTGPGRENITSIVANTTGFSFISSSPLLPVTLPNATQPYLHLTLAFASPEELYVGPFNYTVYLDQYPGAVDPAYHSLTSILEVQIVTSHFGSASNTVTYLVWHNGSGGLHSIGQPLNFIEPYWNVGTGSLSITSIVSNTTGFTLMGTEPALPVSVPNSPDAASGNVTMTITFQVPTTQFIGHFEYIVYFDDRLA